MSTGVIPFSLLCVTAALWWFTAWYGHHLLRVFRDRFPGEASREIPFAYDDRVSHPGKVLYFFRRQAAEIVRSDPDLCCKRRRLIKLLLLCVVFPTFWTVSMFIYAVIKAER